MPIRIERLTGAALQQALPGLARLRIAVFRAFPYLYDGSQEYEERYLATYARAPGSVVVGAFDGGTMVGAATAIPLRHETEEVKQPFRAAGLDVERIFYFGESVLLPDWRGQGIGVAFFEHREAEARLGGFDLACFCAVQRVPDDSRRPAGYVPLDAFWRRRGFEPFPGLTCYMSWTDLGESAETAKSMQFWWKDLSR